MAKKKRAPAVRKVTRTALQLNGGWYLRVRRGAATTILEREMLEEITRRFVRKSPKDLADAREYIMTMIRKYRGESIHVGRYRIVEVPYAYHAGKDKLYYCLKVIGKYDSAVMLQVEEPLTVDLLEIETRGKVLIEIIKRYDKKNCKPE